MFIRFTLMIFALLLLLSCEEVVELDVDFDPKVVVVSEVAPNRIPTVSLSRAKPILSQAPTEYIVADRVSITNRRTEVSYELSLQEITKDTLNPNLERFPFYFTAERNVILSSNNYELAVEVDGEGPILAITTIPQRVDIQSLTLNDFSKNADPRSDNLFDINFDINFRHNELTADNYHLVFYFVYIVEALEESDTVLYYYTQIPTVNTLDMSAPYIFDFENGVLVQGADISDGQLSLRGDLSVDYDEDFSNFPPELWVELRNTNTDYHNYHFSLSRQRSQRDSILSQAILVPSNINNGLGIFSGYNFDIQSVQVTN